jgi:uncharacterized membrane protein (DUF106 family)
MAILDPVLGWSLAFPALLGIFLLSLIVTLISNLIYKFTTNQAEMKSLKDQIEQYRKKIKDAKDDPKKMMKLNNEAMSVNMKYLSKSMKPMLFTFLPIILIIGWMNANYAYEELTPGDALIISAQVREGFSGELVLDGPSLQTPRVVSPIVQGEDGLGTASFAVQGATGSHDFTILYNDNNYGGNSGQVLFGESPTVAEFAGKGPLESITVDYPRVKPLGSFSLFGWEPGWLSVYIILSIALSFSTRKLMKLY